MKAYLTSYRFAVIMGITLSISTMFADPSTMRSLVSGGLAILTIALAAATGGKLSDVRNGSVIWRNGRRYGPSANPRRDMAILWVGLAILGVLIFSNLRIFLE